MIFLWRMGKGVREGEEDEGEKEEDSGACVSTLLTRHSVNDGQGGLRAAGERWGTRASSCCRHGLIADPTDRQDPFQECRLF